MKHKATYEIVQQLIDEREVDETNLETARDELFALVERDQECAWAYGLLAEVNQEDGGKSGEY